MHTVDIDTGNKDMVSGVKIDVRPNKQAYITETRA